jgi:hypothetical protein
MLSLHILARHSPNYFPPAEVSITLRRSALRNIFFSISFNGYSSRSFWLVKILISSLMRGPKLGWLKDPPISILFSPGRQMGDFLPKRKSQARSTNLTLRRKIRPSSPSPSHPKSWRISKKFSKRFQFFATLVVRRLRHFRMNYAHNEAGYSTVIDSPYSLVLFMVSLRKSLSFSTVLS